jgi:hypothetical protein
VLDTHLIDLLSSIQGQPNKGLVSPVLTFDIAPTKLWFLRSRSAGYSTNGMMSGTTSEAKAVEGEDEQGDVVGHELRRKTSDNRPPCPVSRGGPGKPGD